MERYGQLTPDPNRSLAPSQPPFTYLPRLLGRTWACSKPATVYVRPVVAASLRWSAWRLSSTAFSGLSTGGVCSSSVFSSTALSFACLVMFPVCKPMLIRAWESRGKRVTIAAGSKPL
jgi:hypothetical protein